MQSIRSMSPVLRAIGVIGVVAALVTSITFAALSSSATLEDNTISSATASLLVSSDCATFDATATGFAFDDAIPGGDPVPDPAHVFCLDNDGDVDMDISVAVTSTPVVTGTVDLSLVDVILSCVAGPSGNTFAVTADLDSLIAGSVDMTSDPLLADDTAACGAQVAMDSGAVDGSGASITDVDLEFTGTNTAETL